MNKDKDHLKIISGGGNSYNQLPPLIRQIKESSYSVFQHELEELFSICDDLFFDLSNRANSNAEQTLYFESMRELRVKKTSVLNAFRQNYDDSFLRLLQDPKNNKFRHDSADADSLSLVQNDELEEDVAIQSMANRARSSCQEELHQLTTRFDYLMSKTEVTADNNPLDPANLCKCLVNACQLLDINIKAKIIIYKQFERHILNRVNRTYNAANELLINAGVLTRITRKIRKEDSAAHSPASSAPTSLETPAGAAPQQAASARNADFNYSFTELSNLLNSLKQLNNALPVGFNNYTNNPGPLMTNQELYSQLTGAQLASDVNSSTQTIRNIIHNILISSDANAPRSLLQNDEDVINLVAMFFDFVLDDRNLPVAIQALISRLQIPILKAALKDKSFFNNASHPARKLVNLIASSSIGVNWTESDQENKDETIRVIQEIVHEVNEQYRDNDEVFVTQIARLEDFINKQKRNIELIERRTNQTVEGQAKTQKGKNTVQALLFEKLHEKELPEAIIELLVNDWQQYLLYAHIKYGEDSTSWVDACQFVDDLLWCCIRHTDSRAEERAQKLMPMLLKQLTQGLSQVAISAEACAQKTAEIEQALRQLHDPAQPVSLKPLSSEQAVALGHTPGSGSKNWKNLTALERQQLRYKQLSYEYIKKADTLPLGTWLAYEDSQKGKIIRCKLTAKLDITDTYVFVNRLGFKVLEKNRKDLAYDMQQKRAIVLDNSPVFDRAMSAVVENIKKISSGRNDAQ